MMKKYESYKYSGINGVGDIPIHWELKKVKYVTNQIIDGAHFTPTYVEEGVPFLRVTDIQSEKIDLQNVKRIPVEEHDALIKRCKPEIGDLLLSKNGTIGITKLVDWDWEFSIFVSLCLIKFKTDLIKPDFFSFFFQSEGTIQQIAEGSKKTSVTNLHLEKIKELVLTLPPFEEQESIVEFLGVKTSQIDNLIQKKQQMIALLEEEKTAVINEAVTRGLNPDAPMKDSGVEWLGMVPEHWKVTKVGVLSDCITGYAFKSENFSHEDGIRIVRGDNVTEGKLRWGSKTRLWKDVTPDLERFYLEPNDIVIGMDGSKVGKNYAIIQQQDLPLLLVQRVARIRTDSELVATYIYFCVGSYNFKYYVNFSKTDPAIPHITLKNIKDFPIALPPHGELGALVGYIQQETNSLNSTLKKIKQEISLLQEYRTALISEAITGKIEVRDYQPEQTLSPALTE